MVDPTRVGPRSKIALVLAGGSARGAYEVGVVQHIVEEVARSLGRDVPLDILCGTSIGAINACALAAFADEPRARGSRLSERWLSLRIADVLQPDRRELFAMLRSLVGLVTPSDPGAPKHGGFIDPAGLVRILEETIPFERIDEHLRQGRLSAVTVSTTHIATGRTIVFVQRAEKARPLWNTDATILPRAAQLRAPHALASAAIPMLFPAVQIDGEYYCDGGLRQNVPLSPARRLGADGLLVINPRYLPAPGEPDPIEEPVFPGPLLLFGKTLNALLLDRIDNDIDRLNRINQILEAGRRRYGEGFLDEINEELSLLTGKGVRPLRTVLIRASQDIGALAGDFVRSSGFQARVGGVTGRLIRRLAEGDGEREADLLSYLLFDGDFARQLIELGHRDARARHEELCAFFEALAPA
jgi:NTE family protein